MISQWLQCNMPAETQSTGYWAAQTRTLTVKWPIEREGFARGGAFFSPH